MLVTPLHQRYENWREVATSIGEPVFVAFGTFLVADLFEDALFDQATKPGGEQVRRNPKFVAQLTKAMSTSKYRSKNK